MPSIITKIEVLHTPVSDFFTLMRARSSVFRHAGSSFGLRLLMVLSAGEKARSRAIQKLWKEPIKTFANDLSDVTLTTSRTYGRLRIWVGSTEGDRS